MTDAPLTPFPLDVLMGRIRHEWESRSRIFDLPTARFWAPDPAVDLSFSFLGRRAATPVGPAAGPHSQMAQNIVLGWLGGARLFELKTIQVLDELVINRPCIDMQTIGYNIEWSQELSVAASLEEYVKAWMAIHLLRQWEPLVEHLGPNPGAHVFDMSVGYDLAGISTDKVAGFIEGLIDARAEIDRLRPQIPAPFNALPDLDFPTRVADTVTLSTFHGCPPHEIDQITRHLMTRHGVDVIVKLNPTLLGFDRVTEIIHGNLGFDEVVVRKEAFDADLQFDQALELIVGLNQFAASNGRRFGVKLTNTLVVGNHKGFMPDDPMYLSGPPLHVLATALLDRLMAALPGLLGTEGGPVQVSFSAGVNKENLSETIGLGVVPATICSDLLKPGGYGRLEPMLRRLSEEMKAASCFDLESWRRHRTELASQAAHPHAPGAHLAQLQTGEPYRKAGNSKLPRSVDHTLEMWGCVACNFCVTVCPNDAFFRLPTPEGSGMDGRQQYLLFAELCNECGNCLVFCPEEGDPAVIKPKLFLDRDRFLASSGQGFLVERVGDEVGVLARPGWEAEVPVLAGLLRAQEGLPVLAEHLAGDR
ncbi:MAG: 4Fe-4S dicluster domain-containing protein [Acidimicrobiia bacterium]